MCALLFPTPQIEVTSSAVTQHCSQMQIMSSEFVATQKQLQQVADQQVQQLQTDILQQLEGFKAEVHAHAKRAAAQLQDKGQELQRAVSEIVQQMLTEGNAAFAAGVASTDTFCTGADQRLQEGARGVTAAQVALLEGATQQAQRVDKQCEAMGATHDQHMAVVEQHRSAADTTTQQVTSTVGQKRKFLDETVQQLAGHVEGAIEHGVDVVQQTATTAKTVLTNVSAASSKMNETVSESMTTFGRYMDKEGEELSSALGKHFGVVGTHLEAQAGGLSALRECGEQHGQSIADSTLQPRSTTPRKLRKESSSSLQPLKRSRGVEEVAQQAREDVAAAATAAGEGGVTYETASEQLHEHHFNPATLPAVVSAAVAAASIYIDEGELSEIESYSEVMVEDAPIELSETPCEVACNSADSGEAMAAGQAESTEGAGNFDDDDEVEAGDEDGENAHPNSTPVPAAAFCEPLVSKSAPGIDNGSSRLPRTSASSKGTKGAKGTKGKSTTGLRKTRSSAASVAMAESV